MTSQIPASHARLLPDLAFPLALVIAVGCVFLVDQQTPARSVTSTDPAADEFRQESLLTPTDRDPGSELSQPEEPPDVPVAIVADPVEAPEDHGSAEAATTTPDTSQKQQSGPRLARLVLDAEGLRNQQQQRASRQQAEQDQPAKVEFFATESRAETVVFVVDCSSSMAGNRMMRTRAELAQSILDLKPRQKFFVYFFSDGPIAMFQRQQAGLLAFLGGAAASGTALTNMVAASGSMKLAVFKWMQGIGASGGTNPERALLKATELQPDVIYLLSDGEFSALGPSTFAAFESAGTVVHTLAFEDRSGAVLLKSIADRTGGSYQFIPASGDVPDVGGKFESQVTAELIDELTDRDEDVRQQAHSGLVEISGKDFGPSRGATPDEVAASLTRWIRWWAEEVLAKELAAGPDVQLLAEFSSPDPARRLAAVLAVGQKTLNVPDRLIPMLKDSEPAVRTATHEVLVRLSRDRDYGPDDVSNDAAVDQAIAAWKSWAKFVKLVPSYERFSRDRLIKSLEDADAAQRWAAVAALSAKPADRDTRDATASALITVLNDTNSDVLREVKRALLKLSMDEGAAFGPPDTPTDEERAEAIKHWTEWRVAQLDGVAAGKYRLARVLYESGKKKRARDWLQDIVKKFPGTPTAVTAQKLIKRIDSSPSP